MISDFFVTVLDQSMLPQEVCLQGISAAWSVVKALSQNVSTLCIIYTCCFECP